MNVEMNSLCYLSKLMQINSRLSQIHEIKRQITKENNSIESQLFFNNLFKTEVKVNQNLEKLHSESKSFYNCFWPKCEFRSKQLCNLEQHQLIHKNIKQFKCNFKNCNKMFYRK